MLVAISFLEIAGSGRSSAYSVIIPGVGPEVSECGGLLPIENFSYFVTYLSFSAFYGRISCIHCQMLCDLQINLS